MNIGEIGLLGEKRCVSYLKWHGYEIVEQNFQSRFGEIDIIARKKELLIFVEVKTRDEKSIAEPKEFVTYSKQAKIIRTAEIFLMKNHLDCQVRFDVMEVYVSNKKVDKINHIINAFSVG
ncbi:hypothetical protein SDC9_121292 [bioreactor metagenome]|uniref:Uncharacterized protein n=1 Tax=bioreactor metagenome TaxID=1076179 RepID=A0A645CBI3_9ZZZZ